jgi:hypothetical protein
MAQWFIFSLWLALSISSLYQMTKWEKYLSSRDKTNS